MKAIFNHKAIMNFMQNLADKAGNRASNIFAGKMKKKQQMEMFGKYYGRGTIGINIETGEVDHQISLCFGTDSEVTASDNMWDDTKSWSNR